MSNFQFWIVERCGMKVVNVSFIARSFTTRGMDAITVDVCMSLKPSTSHAVLPDIFTITMKVGLVLEKGLKLFLSDKISNYNQSLIKLVNRKMLRIQKGVFKHNYYSSVIPCCFLGETWTRIRPSMQSTRLNDSYRKENGTSHNKNNSVALRKLKYLK